MKHIQRLLKLAQQLDNKAMHKLAETIDDLVREVTNPKTHLAYQCYVCNRLRHPSARIFFWPEDMGEPRNLANEGYRVSSDLCPVCDKTEKERLREEYRQLHNEELEV